MSRKGSVLILSLWVLILLVLFAMSVGFRSRLATKIEGFESDRFTADYDLLAAVNLARFFIESDQEQKVDYRDDEWYGVPDKFEETGFSERFDLEIIDEESKINLNQAPHSFLLEFFDVLKRHHILLETESAKLAANISAWKGERTVLRRATVAPHHKPKLFETVEELRLVPEMTPHDFELLKPFLTVYGKPSQRQTLRVNLNTVHPYVLEALISSFGRPGLSMFEKQLLESIEAFRTGAKGSGSESEGLQEADREVFHEGDLEPQRLIQKLELPNSNEFRQLVGQLRNYVTVDSEFFSVHVTTRPDDGLSRSNARTATLHAVLGPRFFERVSRLRDNDAAIPQGRPVTVPLEILFWQQGTAS